MKRFMLVAACVVIALAACTKPENGGKDKLQTPQNKTYHASYTLSDSAFDTALQKGKVPKTIELTSGGTFLLGFLDTDAVKPDTAPLVYKSGKYSVIELKAPSANLMFTFGMYGSLTIKQESGNDNWVVEYTEADGTSHEGAAILTGDQVSGVLAENLCRSWKPKSLIVSASGGDITEAVVGKVFSADLNEIFDYLIAKGMKFDPADYAQYELQSIDITESGMFIINFKDFAISPFVGNFSLDESKDENIAYDFTLSWQDNPVIPVRGNGSVNVDGSQMTLYTESDVTISAKVYHISVSIICDEIK